MAAPQVLTGTGAPRQVDPELAAEAKRLAALPSYERARAEAMGFKFGELRVRAAGFGGIAIEQDFRCVCGRHETFAQHLMDEQTLSSRVRRMPESFDIAAEIRRFGSFDREHLLRDGYKPAEVDRIVALGEAFDESAAHALDARRVPIRESSMQAMEDFYRMTRGDWRHTERTARPAKAR